MSEDPQHISVHPAMPSGVPQVELLRAFANRYIWWKTADEALLYPDRILAQVMNLGTYEDIGRLLMAWTADELRLILAHAEPGWFNERSWMFWHRRLGVIPINGSPPLLPRRSFAV